MGWVSLISNAVQKVGQRLNRKQPSNQAKTQQQAGPKTSKPENQKQSETKIDEKEKAKAEAQKVKEQLQEKGGGSYPVQETKGHDGSKPQGGYGSSTEDNSTSSVSDFNPPREPSSSYRGKAKDHGRSL